MSTKAHKLSFWVHEDNVMRIINGMVVSATPFYSGGFEAIIGADASDDRILYTYGSNSRFREVLPKLIGSGITAYFVGHDFRVSGDYNKSFSNVIEAFNRGDFKVFD